MLNKPAYKSLPLIIWLLPHAGIALALLLSLLAGPVRINTNLFDILPASHALRSAAGGTGLAEADKTLSDRNGRQVSILVAGARGIDGATSNGVSLADFEESRRAAVLLYETLSGTDAFETLSLYVDEMVMDQFSAYMHQYRYVLLNEADRALLENGGAQEIASDALAAVFGAFSFSPLDNLETDPFFLAGRGMNRFLASSLLSSGSLSLRDDVLAAQYEGRWYVMLRGTITPEGASVTNKNSSVKKIYAAINTTGAAIKAGGTDPDFICSGVPFHSYESSSRAQREISLISTVTLILIIVILFCVFRSLLPAIFSFLAIGISLLLAGSTTLLVFREIHVLSFVFGTTLIGTCVDYSIHYFIHWKGNPSLKTGSQIRSHIFRGIVMSFASTEICFAVLLLAPFGILRQFAVFSLAGMLSSFLTVICLFPYLKIPVNERQIHVPFCGRYCGKKDLSSGGESRNLRDFGSDPEREGIFRLPLKRICLAAIVVISLSLLFVNRDQARVENNISGLYTMSGKLLESERIAAGVLNHGSSGWYFLVSGSSPEETLEQEEALRRRLDTEVERGALGSYLASSLFVPSIQIQQQSYEAAKFLLPLADKQFSSLGFPPETADEFGADFAAAQGRYILPEEGLPPYLRELISNLWIGNPLDKGGTSSAAISSSAYYSCVLPLHAKDETPLRAIAGELDGVFFMNKLKDVGSELDALTRTMLFLFIAAYVLIAIVTRCFYSWRQTFRICAVPFLMALVMVTVLACLNIPLGFFSVTGIVLVFGLGLDYMFYITESRKAEDDSGIRTLTQDLGPGGIRTETSRSALTILAIGLSFVTTALSFGALGLSGFTPVHIFGLTVFTGLTTAFIVSMLLSGFDRRHNPL